VAKEFLNIKLLYRLTSYDVISARQTFTFTFTFIHLADAFIQSDLQMRTIEAVKLTVGQQYVSAITPLSLILVQFFFFFFL
jgi:hypothetical protein